ncbi:MAG TPA: hypothetical protein VIJ13_02315 [Actinomycetota bacterium]|jgi:hypothetical protein
MEAVTGADLKASIIATVQAAALGALLTTVTPDKLTGANRVLFVAGIGALLVGVGTAGAAPTRAGQVVAQLWRSREGAGS